MGGIKRRLGGGKRFLLHLQADLSLDGVHLGLGNLCAQFGQLLVCALGVLLRRIQVGTGLVDLLLCSRLRRTSLLELLRCLLGRLLGVLGKFRGGLRHLARSLHNGIGGSLGVLCNLQLDTRCVHGELRCLLGNLSTHHEHTGGIQVLGSHRKLGIHDIELLPSPLRTFE